ncbi:MAG: hypothetical protein EOL87_02500 [Spartobacteria bacterium]|nr:hypothetical protein [Spartobacteria bacterium]
MENPSKHDFWYAVNFTELVVVPRQSLETFGNTIVSYQLITEVMDDASKVRIREGRLEALRPQIIAPQDMGSVILDGFEQEAAADYAQWLRTNFPDMMMLKYGFSIRKQEVNDHVVTDSIEHVTEKAKAAITQSNQVMSALLTGVDEPWEVCLMKLVMEMIHRSIPKHYNDLREDPDGRRHAIEKAFLQAARNKELIPELQQTLQQYRVFDEYQDRFFSLVKQR